jgi:hypothetical protein
MKKAERKTQRKCQLSGLAAASELFSSLKTMVLQHWLFLRTLWSCVHQHSKAVWLQDKPRTEKEWGNKIQLQESLKLFV